MSCKCNGPVCGCGFNMNDADYRNFVMSKVKNDFNPDSKRMQNRSHIAHMMLGIVGEFAETQESVFNAERANAINSEDVPEAVEIAFKELGDLDFYVHGLICGLVDSGTLDADEMTALDFRFYGGEPHDLGAPPFSSNQYYGWLNAHTRAAIFAAAEHCKKFFAYGKFKNVLSVPDNVRVLNEYVYVTAQELGRMAGIEFPMQYMRKRNVEKLSDRYQAGFTAAEAVAKADQK